MQLRAQSRPGAAHEPGSGDGAGPHKLPVGPISSQHSVGREVNSESCPPGILHPVFPSSLTCPISQTRKLKPREVRGPAAGHTASGNPGQSDFLLHGSHCAPGPAQPGPGAVRCRHYGHFRKDSRLHSYPIAGQGPKLYNLLPHPKGPSVSAPRGAS